MDEIFSNVIAVGFPAVIVKYSMVVSGLHGAPAFNTALKALGKGDMYRGAVLILVSAIGTKYIADAGFEKLSLAVITQLYKQGNVKEDMIETIERMPVSTKLKLRLKDEISKLEAQVI